MQVARQERRNPPSLHRAPGVTTHKTNKSTAQQPTQINQVTIGYGTQTDKPSLCRHRRTHDRVDGGEGNLNSGEEEEQYSGEDQPDSLEDASPTSENGYVAGISLDSAINGRVPSPSSASSLGQSQFNTLQTLSMPMTISQPQAINAGGML